MKRLSDYIFSDSWQLGVANLNSNEEYDVLFDVGDLKQGDLVKFIGFVDVDNHYGIFVFVGRGDNILEVSGDCSGPGNACITRLKAALSPN